jgi:hypothetical protein
MKGWLVVLACARPADPDDRAATPPARERRVMALVVIDGLRRDRVGIYGGKGTPTLDRFAARATVFDEARTVSPSAPASMRTLLSGRAPPGWSETDHLGTQLAAADWETVLVSDAGAVGAGWSSVTVRDAPLAELALEAKRILERESARDLFVALESDDLARAETVDAYDRAVGEVDAALAPLLDATATAVTIVTSTRGAALGEHGVSGHGPSLYEEVVHVPLLVRAPGVAPGRRSDTVSLLDVAPTLRALAGAPSRPSPGRGLLMMGAPRLVAFGWVDGAGAAFGSWLPGEKWIFRDGRAARFDLRADPDELHPIAATDVEARRARIAQALGVTADEPFTVR